MTKDLFRVQGLTLSNIELENDKGPVTRQLLELWGFDLFQQGNQEALYPLRLVFDQSQLARLRDQLLALDLPDAPDIPVASVQ